MNINPLRSCLKCYNSNTKSLICENIGINMENFKNLFGIPANEVQSTCLIVPFLHKGMLEKLNVAQMHRGSPFSAGQGKGFTLIHTMIGATFVGDATLKLADTNCKEIIMIGACGIIQNHSIGSICLVNKAYNYESFTNLVNESQVEPTATHTDQELYDNFFNEYSAEATSVDCASFGSILLEEKYRKELIGKNIDVVDLECSAFYSAAKTIKRPALAILYATDIIGETSPFSPLTQENMNTINTAQQKSIDYFLNFIR